MRRKEKQTVATERSKLSCPDCGSTALSLIKYYVRPVTVTGVRSTSDEQVRTLTWENCYADPKPTETDELAELLCDDCGWTHGIGDELLDGIAYHWEPDPDCDAASKVQALLHLQETRYGGKV